MRTKKISILLVGLMIISTTIVAALNLPSNPVTLNAIYDTDSYFICTLSDVPAGYDVTDGDYPGWCLDYLVDMPRNVDLSVRLYNYDDAGLPATFQDDDWDKVLWIINNKGSYLRWDIQYAIWYYINELPWDDVDPATQARSLIALANTSGEGYTPQSGDITAVVAVPIRTDVQCTFIEVEIPEEQGGCTYTPGYWKNHAVGKHADPTWEELTDGPDTIFYGNTYNLTWLSVMNFNAKQAKDLGLKWTDVQVYQHLAFHYVAAVLNGYYNGYLPSEIQTLISDAEQIFNDNHDMILDSTETASAKQISSMLADFNEGTLYDNWPHCGD